MIRSRKFIKVAVLELDPGGAALLFCAAAGIVESGGIAVDAEDAAAGAYDVRGQKCDISMPEPMSNTRIPGASPAARKNFSVNGRSIRACSIKRSYS